MLGEANHSIGRLEEPEVSTCVRNYMPGQSHVSHAYHPKHKTEGSGLGMLAQQRHMEEAQGEKSQKQALKTSQQSPGIHSSANQVRTEWRPALYGVLFYSCTLNQDGDKLASILGHCGPAYQKTSRAPELRLLLVTIETRHPRQVAVTGKEQDIQSAPMRGG